ncbi:MAG TPA: hypothetical protein VGM93_15515 [Acidimicrobiales bacterium]
MPAHRFPLLALVVSAGLAVGAGACSSGSSSGSATTSTPVTMATTTSKPVTKPATTKPATTVPAKVGYFTPQQAADHLMGAWKANDRIGAAQGASAGAVEDIFKVPPTPFTLYNYCEDPSLGQSGCLYRYGQATVQVNTKQHPEGWVVVSIFYSPN